MQFFKRDMKILRPYLPSPWRTDHACLLRCLPLFIYSAHGDNPRTGHCSYRWTSHRASLTSHSSRLHPEALAGAWNTGWKQTVASVIATGCTQDWLCVEQVLPSLCSSGAQAEDGGGAFPGQWFPFFMLNFKHNGFLWLKQDKGQQASTLPPKPTGMRVTSHWSHAKVQSCILAPQLHYSESQAFLVSRNAFRVDFFRISRKIFCLCVFPHLRVAPGSPVGGLLVFKQLVSFQKQEPPSCGHICGST